MKQLKPYVRCHVRNSCLFAAILHSTNAA